MNGAPAKPISGTSPSSPTSSRNRLADRRTCWGSSGLIAATSAAVRIGWAITGPTSGTMSRSMPGGLERHHDVGEQDRGVDVVAAHRLHGDLADQLRRRSRPPACVCLARSARYSGSERPAWRMNHTGSGGFAAGGGGQIGRLGQFTTGTHRLHAAMCPPGLSLLDHRIWAIGAPAHTAAPDRASVNRRDPRRTGPVPGRGGGDERRLVRPEIELGPIRPPQRLAPYSYALGAEVRTPRPPSSRNVPKVTPSDG